MARPPSALNQPREMSDSDASRRPVADTREGEHDAGFSVHTFPSEQGGLTTFEAESEIPYRSQARKRVVAATRPLLIALAAGTVVVAVSLTYMTFRQRGLRAGSDVTGTAGRSDAASATGMAQFDSRPTG